ncbi:MAG: hypothetical protein QOG87_818 [Actinomycetota bacterium]
MQRTQRGQALPLLALVIVLGGGAVVLLGRIGGAAVERARAVSAADAAALAGAADGSDAAAEAAEANGARVRRYEDIDGDTRVRVSLGDAEATARARRINGGAPPPPGRDGAAPALLAALARADQVLGGRVLVTTVHRGGLEATVGPAWADRLAGASSSTGLCRPSPADPLRFSLCT